MLMVILTVNKLNQMPLSDTLVLGPVGSTVSYVNQFRDNGVGNYSVAGLTPNAAKVAKVSHEKSNSGKLLGTLVEIKHTVVDPGSAIGATRDNRVSLIIKRSEFTTPADIKSMITHLKTIVDSTAIQDQLLNFEV
jgi:hypothetical protein